MSTESQRQGLERGVFLSLISSRRKELISRSPNNGRFWGKRWRPHFRLREWEEEGAGHEGRDRETAWPLLAMGSWEPVRDRHPSTQDPWFGEGSTRWIPVPPPFLSVQSLSRVRLFATPWTAARQASLSITNSWSLLKPMFIKSVMPSSYLILCHPLLLLPPIPPSIRVFSNKSTLRIRWPNYWSFSFSISPSNEHPGLISFRMDWLNLLAVQGTFKSLFQHHSSKHQFFGA